MYLSNNATYGAVASGSTLMGLAAGDTVQVSVLHTAGAPLDVATTTLNSSFWASYISPV